MQETYTGFGVRFRYPENWDVSEAEHDDQVSITAASPETSFWSLTLLYAGPDPEQVLESAVEAFREEYEELDVYPSRAELCHRSVLSRDIEFVCLELINSAFLRAFQTDRFTALVLFQGTDHELEETRDALDAISASLECDFEDVFR